MCEAASGSKETSGKGKAKGKGKNFVHLSGIGEGRGGGGGSEREWGNFQRSLRGISVIQTFGGDGGGEKIPKRNLIYFRMVFFSLGVQMGWWKGGDTLGWYTILCIFSSFMTPGVCAHELFPPPPPLPSYSY